MDRGGEGGGNMDGGAAKGVQRLMAMRTGRGRGDVDRCSEGGSAVDVGAEKGGGATAKGGGGLEE